MSEHLQHRASAVPGPAALRSRDLRPLPLDPSQVRVIQSDAEAIEVAQTLAGEFAVGAGERDRERRLPWDELDRYTASGLGGIAVPKAYGGAGASFVTLAEVFRLLCAADPALGQIPQNQFGVLFAVHELASDAQKQRLYARILAGERFGNAGPARGTASMLAQTTRLHREDGSLRLSGTRFYSTGALFAHWIPSRAEDEQGRTVLVFAPRHAEGVRVVDDWSGIGQRTTASGTVHFSAVAIEPEDVLPAWQLIDRPGLSGPASQLIQAAIDAGIAQAAIDDTLRFVRERARPWTDFGGERASDDPYIIQAVGRLEIDLHAANEVLRETAETLDRIAAKPISAESSAEASLAIAAAKILTTEIALDASEKLFELAGTAATRSEHNLDRHWRNARTHTLHDPVRWKYHLLGNYALNGVLPKRHQWN